ncbi:glycosyl hydrolase catalytic core-domain-containing protein [Lophiotrema nucula]|uniref:Glycosyl hydrolase catalytic core-domain-containing protein n=1 Tax=Lophiotrema nucula TaxID=690887 RepID=A0A6A5ZIW2_9PLEO|nr:glycosyl hydrolase catalytic core-domain-containing protein [Lophiotrema nucula]
MSKPVLFLSLLTLSSFVYAAPAKSRREQTKRGLAFDYWEGAYTYAFSGVQNHFSWMYNWGSSYEDAISLPFVPMLHDNMGKSTEVWNENVEKAYQAGAREVFSVNEPDQCGGGGACIQDVQGMVDFHKTWMQPLADKYDDLRISTPPITDGVPWPNGTKMGVEYLKEFVQKCDDCQLDFVVAHWYNDASNVVYFKNHLQDVYSAGGKRPVWLTEFGTTGGDTGAFMKEVLPWLDQQDWIERYAYHYAHPGILLTPSSTPNSPGLSELGRMYATT